MNLIVWKEEYKLDIKEIDEQHKKMFAIINSFFAALKESNDRDVLVKVFEELTDYASYHFATEEKYFVQFKYAETETHIKTHELYKEKIVSFMEAYNKGKDDLLAYELLDFLEDWWVDHINGIDRKYIECFRSNGLS